MKNINVLIVEDKPDLRNRWKDEVNYHLSYSENLRDCRATVELANSLNEVQEICEDGWKPNLAIVDHRLKEGQSGLDVSSWLLSEFPKVHIIANSAYGIETQGGEKVYSLYQKLSEQFEKRIEFHDKYSSDDDEATISMLNDHLREMMEKVLGVENDGVKFFRKYVPAQSPVMLGFLENLSEYIASGNVKTLLLTGEIGSGKTFIAESIHKVRNDMGLTKGDFVALSLPDITATSLESELFGHRKGAFTGADEAHSGAIKDSNDGTILLDEIGDLPVDLQPKLLRLLNNFEFNPVGAAGGKERVEKTKAFFVLATNRDLHKDLKDGNFRKDLYDRISLPQIRVPSLRERKEDIPLLADFFVNEFMKIYTCQMGLGRSAIDSLLDRELPEGGVRNLQNLIGAAMSIAVSRKVKQITPQILSDASKKTIVVSSKLDGATKANNIVEHALNSAQLDRFETLMAEGKKPKDIGADPLVINTKSGNKKNPTQTLATWRTKDANGRTLKYFGREVSERRWKKYLADIRQLTGTKRIREILHNFPEWVYEGHIPESRIIEAQEG